ncbi:MAG: sulfatase-like hydrolase/transferase [Planctomycetaceae bacterium]|nr:sulfatase-like hydrolase/transferase [Planctomycetaceae bacterium]
MRVLLLAIGVLSVVGTVPAKAEQPNILWLTVEDIGPELGCYGDAYADTPNLDRFAGRSLTYLNAWSNAPVCAPARTTLISGLFPPSTGSEHMRSETRLPAGFKMYPDYMRDAGYFCVNPGKEDYNLTKVGPVWDKLDKGKPYEQLAQHQPFMAVFNDTRTHESKIRTRPHKWIHDPAKARIPAYHPDTLEVRQDWAQYYDNITDMDGWFQQQLDGLEAAGLADNTIVFFYGDHGSGMPRSKRWPFNSGLRVPFIVHIPAKFADLAPSEYGSGKQTDRLVSFVDLAPTILSLAGVKPPEHLQGYAFLGKHAAAEQPYVYGFRGRMDERLDLVRSVRNKRYIYIRNYMPHKEYGQHVAYMFETPTTTKWKELFDAGKLTEEQSHFWRQKPTEELYDLENDPDEVHNLADSSEHHAVLAELREAHRNWVFRVRDIGFLPEGEVHTRGATSSPYEVGHNNAEYNLDAVWDMANAASLLKKEDDNKLLAGLNGSDSAVRYWAALGLLMRGERGAKLGHEALRNALSEDDSIYVRTVAAEILVRFGNEADKQAGLKHLIAAADGSKSGVHSAIQAMNVIDQLDEQAASLLPQVKKLPTKGDWATGRYASYVPRLIETTIEDLAQ